MSEGQLLGLVSLNSRKRAHDQAHSDDDDCTSRDAGRRVRPKIIYQSSRSHEGHSQTEVSLPLSKDSNVKQENTPTPLVAPRLLPSSTPSSSPSQPVSVAPSYLMSASRESSAFRRLKDGFSSLRAEWEREKELEMSALKKRGDRCFQELQAAKEEIRLLNIKNQQLETENRLKNQHVQELKNEKVILMNYRNILEEWAALQESKESAETPGHQAVLVERAEEEVPSHIKVGQYLNEQSSSQISSTTGASDILSVEASQQMRAEALEILWALCAERSLN